MFKSQNCKLSICCILLIACNGDIEPCGSDKTDFLLSVDKLVLAASHELERDQYDFDKVEKQMQELKGNCFQNWEKQLSLKEQHHLARQWLAFEQYKLSAKKELLVKNN